LKRIYFDMDGTLAEWRGWVKDVSQIYEKDYFASLNPQASVVNAVRLLAQENIAEIKILSSYLSDSPYAADEKYAWVQKWMSDFIDKSDVILVPGGISKPEFIGHICKDDILVDDYSKNLTEWETAGGTPVKCFNQYNGKSGAYWKNHISALMCSQYNYKYLKRLIEGEEGDYYDTY